MTRDGSRPVVTWLVLTYDRTAAERFPFERRWYRFDCDRATPAEAQEVLRLVGHDRMDDLPAAPAKLGDTRVTISLGSGGGTSREILRYRHLFSHVPDEEDVFADTDEACAFLSVSLAPDSYFEDENEQPITLVEIFDEEARREHGDEAVSIVMDQPESILRLPPAEPVRAELWHEADANLMAQLREVYAHLIRSRWLQSRCVVSPGPGTEPQALLPVHEDCMAVILPFRQLYSKDNADDLFNRCCKIHSRHCPSGHPTYAWVENYKASFNAFLESPVTFPLNQADLAARRYLDAFAYGARVVHATSKKSDPASDLERLLRSHPKAMVVMAYHYILRQLLYNVSMAIPVLRQNVTHWIKDLGWAGGGAPGGRDLFGG